MASNQLTELVLSDRTPLTQLHLDWEPQPGAYLEVEGLTYLVLERSHRYQFKAGRYQLHRVTLHVQPAAVPEEKSLLEGRWVIGNITCRYNARSELLRCAVNPCGPCDHCPHYEPQP